MVTDGVDVRRQRAQRPAVVLLDGLLRVELWDVIVGVDGDQDVGYERLKERRRRRRLTVSDESLSQ